MKERKICMIIQLQKCASNVLVTNTKRYKGTSNVNSGDKKGIQESVGTRGGVKNF